jgi:hypothetical protein
MPRWNRARLKPATIGERLRKVPLREAFQADIPLVEVIGTLGRGSWKRWKHEEDSEMVVFLSGQAAAGQHNEQPEVVGSRSLSHFGFPTTISYVGNLAS